MVIACGLVSLVIAWICRRKKLYGIEKGIYLGLAAMLVFDFWLSLHRNPSEWPKTAASQIAEFTGWIILKLVNT